MTITLVAILCHSLNNVSLCVDEVIPTDLMVVGKTEDPVPAPWNMNICQVDGQKIAADWLANSTQYHNWTLHAWKCVPGIYTPSKRAEMGQSSVADWQAIMAAKDYKIL